MRRGIACAGVCLLALFASARTAWAQGLKGGWLAADAIFVTHFEGNVAVPAQQPVAALLPVVYPALQDTTGFGVGGGIRFTRRAGVAIRYETTSQSAPAALSVVMLTQSGLPLIATGTSNDLERTDHAVDFAIAVSAWKTERFEVQVSGGPTYLRTNQQMVSSITTQQTPPPPALPSTLGITGAVTEKVSTNGFGWHVGGDAAYYFTSHVGVGGGVRLRGGSMSADDPLTGTKRDLDPGQTSVDVGARFRF